MAERPTIVPAVVAALTDGAPKRLVRKLDKTPELAEAWTWHVGDAATTVDTDRGETVTLASADIRDVDQVSCTCLLAPRCLHVLAVITSLGLSAGANADAGEVEAEAELDGDVDLSDKQVTAAQALWRAATEVLVAGANAAGAMPQAELLRAVHGCRVAGLHRASATGVRVVKAIRDLRGDRPEFRLAGLNTDLRELLYVARRLSGGARASAGLIGTARRAYSAAGNLRLYGVFCEPVIAGSGYAGVVTYLVDDDMRFFSVTDVMPGDPGRARHAYRTGDFAGVALAHHEMCRGGLFVNAATASSDGRLGRGAAVKAVKAAGASWTDEPLSRLWTTPVDEQLERHARFSELSAAERPAGWNLVFMDCEVVGTTERSLVLSRDGAAFQAVAPSDHELLSFRHDLKQLGKHPGMNLRVIGRLRLDQPRTVDLLAARCDALSLPEGWGDRVNLGLDTLAGAHVPASDGPAIPVELSGQLPSSLEPMRRRLRRVALGGRATLPPEAIEEVAREVSTLNAQMMPTAAAVLDALASAASASLRDISGERQRLAEPFALAWLRASVFERAATSELVRDTWRG